MIGSRLGPTFCRSWSGSKLFAKVIDRRQKLPLAKKALIIDFLIFISNDLLKKIICTQAALLTLCMLGNFSCFFVVCWGFSKSTFSKNSFRNTIRVSNILDPDLVWYFVGPDLGPIGPNSLQWLTLVGRVKSMCFKEHYSLPAGVYNIICW